MDPIMHAAFDLCWPLIAVIGWLTVLGYELEQRKPTMLTHVITSSCGFAIGWNLVELLKAL